jgi:DHA3 family macrolide efflux protein-like MFS transporter
VEEKNIFMENSTDTSQIPEKWALRFFTFWGGQVVSLVGSSLVQFALVWWMTKTTGSATVLATASLIAILPRILLAPFAGAWVDRWNRKIVMIVADSVIALATLVLMFLFATGRESIWAVYVILLVRAAGGAFHSPAESASISLMVPKAHLARIAGINQTLNGTLNIISPPLGALLIGILPMQGVLAIDVGTAIIAVSILSFITIPHPPRQVAQANGTANKTSYMQDLREGWSYMVAWPGLMGIVLIAMLINFMVVPAFSLIPLVVTQEYHGNALQLGMVDSLFGIGIIVGGLILSAWGGFKKRIITSMLGVIGIGVGIIIFGLMPAKFFYAALGGIFMLGLMQVMANGPLDAILQSAVDPDMQGRVFSLLGAGASAMQPLSLMVAGPVSDWLGVRTWYMIGGSACIIMAMAGLFIPVIMNIEENQQKIPPETYLVETT